MKYVNAVVRLNRIIKDMILMLFMESMVLLAENITKSYNGKLALNQVNFDLQRGEIHSLLGPNGAGKTTLIKIMATLLKKDTGRVNILGFDLDKHENQIRHILGYVGQDTERSAYARLNPVENLRFFGALRGLKKDEIDDRVYKFADYLDFTDNLEKQFMHLSGGQKQIVVIMRALLHDPPVIFLDEPTKGLDPIISKKIRKFLKNIVKEDNKSLLLTSHILSEVDELSNRVSLIHNGEISTTGSPQILKNAVGASEFIDLEINNLPENTRIKISNLETVVNTTQFNEDWVSFGLSDLFDGTASIINLLKEDNVRTGFKHHSVTLEDAFIHHIGVLNESFDN